MTKYLVKMWLNNLSHLYNSVVCVGSDSERVKRIYYLN